MKHMHTCTHAHMYRCTYTDSKMVRVNLGVDSLHIGVGRDDPLFQGQDGFDESSKSTDALEMTNVRFQSTP